MPNDLLCAILDSAKETELKQQTAPVALLAALTCFSGLAAANDPPIWIGTWATSPTGLPTETKVGTYTYPSRVTFDGTIRYRLRISLGGSQIRLRFSNEYASGALALAGATVGIAADGMNAMPDSLKRVTFGGKRAINIPAGAPALTDPIDLPVKSGSDLVISAYVPHGISSVTCTPDYPLADQTTVAGSDVTREPKISPANCLGTLRPLVSEVDVVADRPHKVVVTLGDSITDGFVDPLTGDRGWPGILARGLRNQGVAVVNAGIGGNRLLESVPMAGDAALARLDRDVFSVPGLSHIILLEGINDIGLSGKGGLLGDAPVITPADLIAGYSQIVARAHERRIKIVCATVTPFAGVAYQNYYSEDKEAVREAFNEWIRTSKLCDGVVDFDAAVRDHDHPRQLAKEFDSGDHLHPNPVGHRKMSDAIDLHLFD